MILSVTTVILYALMFAAILFLMYCLSILILLIGIDQKCLNIRLGDKTIKPVDYTFYKDLKKEEFSFYSNKNKLNGGIYYHTLNKENIAIVVHGYGANHKNYFPEINYLCSLGYTVYAYDGTGTSISEGKKFGGAPQAIKDLEACINEVKKLNPDSKILLFGHSMGAYAVCNVLNVCSVDKVIALAPFDNMPDIINDKVRQKMGKNFFLLKPIYKLIQKIKFGKYANFTTYKTLSNSHTPVLVVHGEFDKTVLIDHFLENMNSNTNPYTKFLFVKDKLHRPLQSSEAVTYHEYLNLQLEGLEIKYKNKIPEEEIIKFNDSINRFIQNDLDQEVINKLTIFLKES